MDPWSPPELTAVFGMLDAKDRQSIQELLRDSDRLLQGVVSDLDCGFVYTTAGCEMRPGWATLEAQLTARRDIDNEDGSRSVGALDAAMMLERTLDHERRWFVPTYVAQNCDRLTCLDDPHELRREDDEADSPLEAAQLALGMTTRLVGWLQARRRDELGHFVHQS